jgi:hypothetical protein
MSEPIHETVVIDETAVVGRDEIVEETIIIDLELYARENRPVPHAKHYKIKIDRKYYEVHVPEMTGRQLLELAEKDPSRFMISEKLRDGQAKKIGLDEVVNFAAHCVERFMTLPLDQTEG